MKVVLEGNVAKRIADQVQEAERKHRPIKEIRLTPREFNALRLELIPEGSGLKIEDEFKEKFGVEVLRGTIDDDGTQVEDPDAKREF